MKSFYAPIATAIFLFLFLLGCDTFNDHVVSVDVYASDDFSYDIPVAQQARVRLENINGAIDVRGAPGATAVKVAGERRVGSDTHSDAELYLSRVTIEIEEGQDIIFIHTEQPDNSRGREVIVDYTITMPPDLAIEIEHINGAVAVRDIVAGTSVHLINGAILCSEQMPVAGLINLQTTNGAIKLEISVLSSAQLTASVTNGQIRTSNLTLTDPVIGSRSLSGKLGTGEMPIRLRTINGDIDIEGL